MITRGSVTRANDNNGRFSDYDVAFAVTDLAPMGHATVTLAGTNLEVVSTTGAEVTCTTATSCEIADSGDGASSFTVRVRVDRLVTLAPSLDATLSAFDFPEAGGTNNTDGWHPLLGVGGLIVL